MKLIWILLFILHLQVFAEGPPSGRFEFIAFKDSLVAFELREMKYIGDEGKVTLYQLDAKTGNLSVIDQKTYDKNFGSAKKHMATDLSYGAGNDGKTIPLSKSQTLTTKYEGCKFNYWEKKCEKQIMTLDKESFALNPSCGDCTVLTAARWGQQLWVGVAALGELTWYGRGFRVEDLTTKKSLYSSEKEKIFSLISIMALSPKEEALWILSDAGISVYDKSFKVLQHCPLVTPLEASGSFKFECLKQGK